MLSKNGRNFVWSESTEANPVLSTDSRHKYSASWSAWCSLIYPLVDQFVSEWQFFLGLNIYMYLQAEYRLLGIYKVRLAFFSILK